MIDADNCGLIECHCNSINNNSVHLINNDKIRHIGPYKPCYGIQYINEQFTIYGIKL